MSSMESSDIDCVMVTSSPMVIMNLMIWAVGMPSASARSLTVAPERMSTGGMSAGFICGCCA